VIDGDVFMHQHGLAGAARDTIKAPWPIAIGASCSRDLAEIGPFWWGLEFTTESAGREQRSEVEYN